MRNYATKFSAGFDDFPGLSPAARKALTEPFLRSFDGALSARERNAASIAFLAALRAQKIPKGSRERIETWYGRIGEWFRSTVPAAPPGNEEVAEAVLFAAKDGRFLENPFLAITTLPPFSSFPPSQGARKVLSGGETGTIVSTGDAGSLHRRLYEALSGKKARVTSLSDAELPDGQARISRPAGHPSAKGARDRAQETQQRTLDLSDPRVVEPWLDNTLVGAKPPAFVVLIVGGDGWGKRDPRWLRGRPPAIPRERPENGDPVLRVRARGAGRRSPRGRRTAGNDRRGPTDAGRPAADRPDVPRRAAFPARGENGPRLPPHRTRFRGGAGNGARGDRDPGRGASPPGSHRYRWEPSGLEPFHEPLTQRRIGKASLLLHRKNGGTAR